MKKQFLMLIAALSLSANEIIITPSEHSVEKSVEKLRSILTHKGFGIFGVIDHGKNAQGAGMVMNKAKVIIFGNPKAGTLLMQENILAGLDLPFRVLVYEDKQNRPQIAYRNGTWVKKTHSLQNEKLVFKIDGALEAIINEAAH